MVFTSKNKATRWRGWAAGTQGDVEAGKVGKRGDGREFWEPPKKGSPIPGVFRAVPGGGCKELGFVAGCPCLSKKAPTNGNGTTERRVWAGRTQGDVDTGRGEKQQYSREWCEPRKKASTISETPRAVPDRL